MLRKLATIQEIAEIRAIDGANAIESVRVKEWWCVAKKGEFKVGDLCVYFEIDSLLPVANTAFEFLARGNKPKKMTIDGIDYVGYKLKTIKLRGSISQGLALPVVTFGTYFGIGAGTGTDVSGLLGVVKYEAPIPTELFGLVKGNFPGFIPKTDEERVQNLAAVVERQQGTVFYITEKLDGSSATFYRHTTIAEGDHFGVCSRNLELLESDGNTFWKLARKYNLAENIPDGYCVQGEAVGEGIQKNPLKLQGHDLYVYNVYDIRSAEYLSYSEFLKFCQTYGLQTVPVLKENYTLDTNVEGLLAMAEGKSVVCPTAEREGIVLRPLIEKQEIIAGVAGRLSFKAISNKFLLAETE